jgi:hypothetical protein
MSVIKLIFNSSLNVLLPQIEEITDVYCFLMKSLGFKFTQHQHSQ